ncbi:MAG: sugar transferase [Myxococcaceae bacterium]|nr:sugar transferase [Myxococcaceae bacterium]
MHSFLGRVAPGVTAKVNLLLDLLTLLLALPVASLLSHDVSGDGLPSLVAVSAAAMTAWLVTATALRHYDPWANRAPMDDAVMVTVLVLAVVTVVAVARVLPGSDDALPFAGNLMVALWPPVMLLRLVAVRPLWVHEKPLDEVLVIGTGSLGRATAADLEGTRMPRDVAGFLSLPDDKVPPKLSHPLLGASADLARCLATLPISEVYIAGHHTRDAEAMQSAIRTCETFGVPFALPASGFRFERARPADERSILDGYLHYLQVDAKPAQMAFKRLFDMVVSAVALWLLLPVLAAVALAIKLTSRGPILFRQVRVGLHGRQFHMLKFRSMVVDAEAQKARLAALNEQTGPVFKMRNDPRITAVGRFIRKYSIDELPQLVNVLRGDMSVVGPRPPVPSEVAKYEAWQRRRLSVRPGLTCIWQVSGRNQISFEDWMYLDMQYIDHWSLKGDLDLILKTVPVVLSGRGAS